MRRARPGKEDKLRITESAERPVSVSLSAAQLGEYPHLMEFSAEPLSEPSRGDRSPQVGVSGVPRGVVSARHWVRCRGGA